MGGTDALRRSLGPTGFTRKGLPIISWLLSTLGKTATWLAENLLALAIAVETLRSLWVAPRQYRL